MYDALELWKLEASLVCEHCRNETGRRAQAYVIGVAETGPPEPSPTTPSSMRAAHTLSK
jgi:hypothetical protein